MYCEKKRKNISQRQVAVDIWKNVYHHILSEKFKSCANKRSSHTSENDIYKKKKTLETGARENSTVGGPLSCM